jgi:hypothetical protein
VDNADRSLGTVEIRGESSRRAAGQDQLAAR